MVGSHLGTKKRRTKRSVMALLPTPPVPRTEMFSRSTPPPVPSVSLKKGSPADTYSSSSAWISLTAESHGAPTFRRSTPQHTATATSAV